MRRLPIYFLIDISESMIGEPIQNVEEGLATIIKALKSDPYAIETVWISVLVFAGQAKTIVPLQEIADFYPPRFPIGGGTSLSKGLGHLMYELRSNIIKTTHEQKGDWKPIIFLLTDGVPTDDTRSAIQEWKLNWQKSTNLVAISFGQETDLSLLTELTEHVLMFNNSDASQYTAFFKWVTDSIKTSSVSVDNSASGFELAKLDDKVVTKIDLNKKSDLQEYIDPNYVVLAAKCQNTKRPYLMKYKKVLNDSPFSDLGLQTVAYRLNGAFQVDNSYYELSDPSASSFKINSEELIGAPTCPSCGNQYGLAICSCGKIHCIGEEEYSTCPWCNTQAQYGTGGGGFDINRTQG
ncbi:TerY-C metal binding domain-containing protein [Pedobacter caeni]|uniref:Uncharacterized conserved protein YegL, contains vWA domain of TerY type n=1 Tax=Pedobacter caeni TaxID=288992 RepID=A0A1M4VNF9_9SPHI|nr:TerY-C metal binding domain-containing protein [Pedobacter caeni]SHE70631.1 Uncharacterized conserved protein YegL, contains vWA domain of TerY type [Pedobacter caeni]